MSRIGKKPILIPEGVEVRIEGQKVIVKGLKGELSQEILSEIKIEIKDSQIFVFPKIREFSKKTKRGRKALALRFETKQTKAFWGLTRALLANMIEGVVKGFEKKLQIEGLGFKAELDGNNLVLQVGFSHSVIITALEGVKFTVEKNIITVSGINKELVGQVAAKIRKVRPPEPYKGKGIRYLGEVIRRKAGKKTATVAG